MMILPFGMHYVKREDALSAFKGMKLYGVIASISLLIVAVILRIFVFPKVEDLYNTFSVQRTFLNTNSVYILLGILILFLIYNFYNFTSKADEKDMETKILKYKSGEMINTHELFSGLIKKQTFNFILSAILVGITVLLYLIPIYSLTASQ